MRVWIINPFDNLPHEGYRPMRFWLMARAFAQAGHAVVYWTSDFSHANKAPRVVDDPARWPDGRSPAADDAINLRLVPTPPYRKNVSLARVRSHRRLADNWLACARREAQRPDLVIASLPPIRLPLLAKAYADEVGAKFVVDIMDDWPGTFYRLLPRALRGLGPVVFARARWQARQLYAGAALVTGCSDRYGDLARAAGARGFYRAYHGITVAARPSVPSLSAPKGLRLLYLGNLGRTYDLTTVLEALARLPDATLDVAGEGEQLPALKVLAEMVAPDRVRFHGYVGQAAMTDLLAGTDVGLVPMAPDSCVGIPYKFADYAAQGLAIVSSLGGESGRLLARYDAGAAYRGGDPENLAATLRALRPRLAAAKAGARRMAEAEFDATALYAAYVRRVTELFA